MGAIASQITSLMIVYSIVYSDADQRKHQSSALLAFVPGIPHIHIHYKVWDEKTYFPFDDIIPLGCVLLWYGGYLTHILQGYLTYPEEYG